MTDPFADLSFSEVHRTRFFEVVDPRLATSPDAAAPIAPYVGVEAVPTGTGVARLGLSGVRAAYDGRRAWIEVDDGAGHQVLRRKRVRVEEGSMLGFALCENQATLLARRPGERWKPLLTERDRVRKRLDLRDPAVLADQRWCAEGVDEARVGPFAMAGLRDPHLVQHADGTPYERDGRTYLTWTCAGLGGFRQAHWGVFSLDPADPTSLRQEAHLYVRRAGRVYGDHAGQLVRDGDRWRVAVSTWGDFSPRRGVHVRHAVTDADLLTGLHVLDTEPAPLAAGWDPCLQRVDDGAGWLVGYTGSVSVKPFRFRPALARTGADDPWTDLRPVGTATGLDQTEGPVLVRRAGRTWLLASDGRSRTYPVFDTDSLQQVGRVDAPYPTNIPHPQLLRRTDGSWLMLTFDGTRWEPRRRETGRKPVLGYGTHGDVVIMEASDGR